MKLPVFSKASDGLNFYHFSLLQNITDFSNFNFSNRFVGADKINSYKNLHLNSKFQTANPGPACWLFPCAVSLTVTHLSDFTGLFPSGNWLHINSYTIRWSLLNWGLLQWLSYLMLLSNWIMVWEKIAILKKNESRRISWTFIGILESKGRAELARNM